MNHQTKVELYQSCAVLASAPQVGLWLRAVETQAAEQPLPPHLRPRVLAEKYGVSLATVFALSMTSLARAIARNYHIEGTMRAISNSLPEQLTPQQEKMALATLNRHGGVLIHLDTEEAQHLLESSMPAQSGFYHFQKHPAANQLVRGLGPFRTADQALGSFHMEWAHQNEVLDIWEYEAPEGVSVTPAFADGTLEPYYLFTHEDGRRWSLEPSSEKVEHWRFCQIEPTRHLIVATQASSALELLTRCPAVSCAMQSDLSQDAPERLSP